MPPLSTHYRTAFVTGASTGLGRAFAEMLLAEGVQVWGTARQPSRLAPLSAHPSFRPVILDLAHGAAAEEAFARAAQEAGGSFDLLINNAGYGVFAPFAAVEFEGWQTQVEAMLINTARLTHAALREMKTRDRGCIVNIASLAVDFPLPFMAGYNVAKAGLAALSESLIFETRGSDVVVIDFRPGDFRTAFNDAMRALSSPPPDHETRLASSWSALEANLQSAPAPAHAAARLRKALCRRRSGTVRAGSFFQARLAPFLARFATGRLRRAVAARYFKAS